ncbi:MAG: hypothetical protein ACTSVY_01035 [Candidatus Helarchaeota archaeon]
MTEKKARKKVRKSKKSKKLKRSIGKSYGIGNEVLIIKNFKHIPLVKTAN